MVSDPSAVVFAHNDPPNGWTPLPQDVHLHQQFSLVFVVDKLNAAVLLGYKKRGFGVGLYNGFGGKPLADEDMRVCAMRELSEESALVAVDADFYLKGRLVITRPRNLSKLQSNNESQTIDISIYICEAWLGLPEETEEMRPQWFSFGEFCPFPPVPYPDMWPEAQLYLPSILLSVMRDERGKQLCGRVEYTFRQTNSSEAILMRTFRTGYGEELMSGWHLALVTVGAQ